MPTQTPSTPSSLDPKIVNLAKAIRQTESGGDFSAKGASGEYGAYQFMPDTWNATAPKYGVNVPLQQATPEQQNEVAVKQLTEWQKEHPDWNVGNFASAWNAGPGKPDAYLGGNAGTNAEGVSYDTAAYAKKVATAYQQFKGQPNSPASSLTPPTAPGQAQIQQPSQSTFGGALQPPTPPQASTQAPAPTTPTPESFTGDLASGNYGGAALKGAENVGNFLFPIAGDLYNDAKGTNTKTGLQQTADAGLSALSVIPGIGELGKGAEAGIDAVKAAPSLLSLLGKGAAYGAAAGGLSSVGQGNTNLGAIAGDTALGGVTGGVTGGLLGRLGGGSGALDKSATEDITKVLAPTGKTDKLITQKIAPQLAKSGIMAASREGLLSKYQALQGTAGDALEAGYDALPKDAQVEVGGLFDTVQKEIDNLTVNGSVPSAAAPKVTALQNMMKDLANIGIQTSPDGSKVFADVANVRQLRQILDTGKQGFAFSDLDTATRAAQKTLANGIRGAFAEQYPDIAKLNKDFSFWSNAVGVLQNTIDRKTGQTGLLRKGIAGGIGSLGGLASGHPVVGAGVGKILSDFIESPAYHTVSAALKNKIAAAFEKGDYIGAGKLMQMVTATSPTLVGRGSVGLLGQLSQK